jgi:hypothetical protein
MQYRSCYATCRRVAGSIPDEATGFFNLPTPSSRNNALGSTQSLTKLCTRNLLEGKGRPSPKAHKFTAICKPIVYKNVGASTSHNSMGLHGLLQG